MSAAPTPVAPAAPIPITQRRRARARRRWLWTALVLAAAAAAAWGVWRLYRAMTQPPALAVPTAAVERGDVNFDVFAQGQLTGGRAEMLVAPMVSGGQLSITYLADNGSRVNAGDIVAKFDTSGQEYNLTQAQEALAQAQQQQIGAQATADAQTEDDHYQLEKARFDVTRAQLQVQSNPIKDSIDAHKNDLNLAAAQAHVKQLEADIASRAASNAASVATQKAAVAKAQADVNTAQHNIAMMTLRAARAGYVALQPNSGNVIYFGMPIPPFKVGDTARPGLAVASIPDTSTWAVDINVSEIDAGHLSVGQPVRVEFIALPGQSFAGELQTVGTASGFGFDRQVACSVRLTQASAALRPGLSADVHILTQTVRNALWAPSQAVFSSGGHDYVYRRSGGSFQRQDITVLRRGESRVIVSGLRAGDLIALANPELAAAAARKPATGAAAALPGGKP